MSENAAAGLADDFAWGDAAFGAVAMSAVFLALGAFTAVAIRHRGRALAR